MSLESTVLTPPTLVLNGRAVELDCDEPGRTLLDFLRARGLTGAKDGCAEGECGACIVVIVTPDGPRSEYRAINSCLMFLPMAAGHEVYTVESLATDGQLSDVQRALAADGGSQCGYCTPGFVVSLFAEQYRPGRTTACDPLALAGNLCRCTGYRPIRDAAHAIGAPPQGLFLERLTRPAPAIAQFQHQRFSRPASVADALAVLAADPDATLVAGASDLAVESNLRGRVAPRLVSVEAIAEMREFKETASGVFLGAALPIADVGRLWHGAPAAVHEWIELFASPSIRNRATLGGNLVTASPIGDAAPLLLALDAQVDVAGQSGRRRVPMASFFTAYRRTRLLKGEIVTAIEIPKPLPAVLRFYKVAKRRLDDISTVAAAMALDFSSSGRIRAARFGFGGMAATPVRLSEADIALTDRLWNESAVELVQNAIEKTFTPISDHRGSAEFRLEVAKSLIEKFWWESREERA